MTLLPNTKPAWRNQRVSKASDAAPDRNIAAHSKKVTALLALPIRTDLDADLMETR
jgi:hypothetical protein